MILPAGATLGVAEEEVRQPSRTYKLDLENNRIAGMVDGIDAVKQAAYKILDTERFSYFIYSGNYGREGGLGNAIDIERSISEALLQDDRITAIEDFQMTVTGDEATVRFTVVSIFGSVPIERGVGQGV
jgi:hypothetical protein